MEERQPYVGQLRICSIGSRGQPTRGGSPAWGLGEVLMTHSKKNWPCNEMDACAWTSRLVRPKEWRRDMRFGTWNVRSL